MLTKKMIFALAAALFASNILAQGSRIGVVDADVVIQKSAKGKAFFEDYQAFVKGKDDEIKGLIEGYQEKQKEYQAKQASLSEEKAKDMALELQRLQTDIKRKREDAERESQLRLNEGLDRFRRELAPLIRQIAQELGLDLVLNFGPNSNMVYFSDKINITEAVIKKYDESNQ